MIYLLVKSVHVCAVMLWVGGMLLQAVQLRMERKHRDPWTPWEQTMRAHLQRWDRVATVPAMAVAWMSGLYIAMSGAWFGNHWLSAKLALVVALSALHGIQAGRLKRQRATAAVEPSKIARLALPSLLGLVGTVIFLVITKPGL